MRRKAFVKLMENVIKGCIASILCFTLIAFFVCNVIFMRKYSDVFSAFEWIWVVPSIALILSIFVMADKLRGLSEKLALVLGALIANAVYLAFLLSFETIPVSDWGEIWKSALEMANGTFTDGLIPGTYMHEIPYQLGLALVESLLIRAFGAEYMVLQIFNLVLMNILILMVYRLAKRKTSRRVAFFAYFAACVFLSWSMTVPQFTNHPLGSILLYLSLHCYDKKEYRFSALSGISLGLLNFIRSMGIIVVLTYICYTFYEIVRNKRIGNPILRFAIFLLCYLLTQYGLDSMLIELNYTDTRVSQSSRNIYHKITYGLYDSQVDGTIADYDYDYDAYDDAFKKELVEKIVNSPLEMCVSIANKITRYLGMFDYGFEMTYNHDQTIWSRYPVKAIYSMQWFQYVFYTALALYGYGAYMKKWGGKPDVYQIFFIGNTLVYLLIEAFSTYRFESYLYFLFLVGCGADRMYSRKSERLNAQMLTF